MIRDDIILEDTTLRDGEQAPGIAFSADAKRAILNALINAGIAWIEVGIPAMGGREKMVLREFAERKNDAMLVAWNRGNLADVKDSLDLGFNVVHIGLPTSNLHIEKSLGKSFEWVCNTAIDLVKYAKDRGAFVSISAEDIARTEPSRLQDYAGRIYEAGADRLRLSDTIGTLTPQGYADRIALVRAATDIDLQCHAHNDFGLGLANTISGLEAGARYFHVTVNGIGERAGMPDLAQMAISLKLLYARDTGVKLDQLTSLSNLVSQATKTPLPPWQPVVGDNAFSHESGIHVRGTLNSENSFEPFPPETVGGVRRIAIGKHSGRNAIQYVLSKNGIALKDKSDDLYERCLSHVREFAMKHGRGLTESELITIYHNLVSEITAA